MRINLVNSSGRKRSTALAVILVSLLAAPASAWQQRPATPAPCSVDGGCRPQGPWGFTGTKWRPWPGDSIGAPKPTAAEEETREQLQLDPFELPTPEKEGERGPKVTKRPKAPAAEAEAPADAPAIVAPPGVAPRPDANEAPEPAVPLPDDEVPLPDDEPAAGGAGALDDFGLEAPAAQPEPNLEQPPALAPPAIEPPATEEPMPEAPPAEPAEDFDPFSQLNGPPAAPPEISRRAKAITPHEDDQPPALPASLRKLTKAAAPVTRAGARDSRYVQAAALVQ